MLLKGCQRRSVCLRASDSRLFEEAFFVLRGDAPATAEGDILAEANRILEENLQRKRARPRPLALILAYLAGIASAAAVTLLVLFDEGREEAAA